MTLRPASAIDTRRLFRPVSAGLVDLLRTLPADAWLRPTAAPAWRVRDVVAHLLDGTLRRLSFQRDRHIPPSPQTPVTNERELVAFINDLNARWVVASERLSTHVLTDLYAFASGELADFLETLTLDGPALFPVSWAGDADYASALWFDIGREFTELCHHAMQVRDAVGAPALADPAALHAFIGIAALGLLHAFRDVHRPAGDTLTVVATGEGGGAWTLRRDDERWGIWEGEAAQATARAVMPVDTACRLLFNALPPTAAADTIVVQGDRELAAPLLRARSVIV